MILLAMIAGQWAQRVDTGKEEALFRAEVAAQFGIAVDAVTVVLRAGTTDDAAMIAAALATGTFEKLAVLAAPVLAAKATLGQAAIDKALLSKSTDDILAALAALRDRA